MTHCEHCLCVTSRKLDVNWRAFYVGNTWVRVCSLMCELRWLRENPRWMCRAEAWDEEAWVWVA